MSLSFNSCTFAGHVTRDAELTEGDKPRTKFGVAINQYGKEAPMYVNCVVFGKQAAVATNLKKGSPVLVYGRISLDEWEKDGKKRSALSLIVNEFQFLGKKEGNAPAEADIPF
jgi:single-strand DNA-binding protein